MALRPKTKRLLLVVATLTFVGGGVVFWLTNGPSAKATQRAAELRVAAEAAMARGDYATALSAFSQHLTIRKPDLEKPTDADLDALLGLAECRRRVPRLGGSHLVEAADHVDRVLKRRDRDPKARRIMMELIQRMDRRPEPELVKARQTYSPAAYYATLVLEDSPGDVEALIIKATAALRGNKPDLTTARSLADQAAKNAPTDHRIARIRLLASALGGTPLETVAGEAEKLAKSHPGDASLLLAASETFADLATGLRSGSSPSTRPVLSSETQQAWIDKAEQYAKEAARAFRSIGTLPSPMLPLDLAAACERQGLFETAADVLGIAQTLSNSAEIEGMVVRKNWQLGRHADVLVRTDKLDPASANTDPDLVGYRGLSLLAKAEQVPPGGARTTLLNQADAIATALTNRKNDSDSSVWAALLQVEANRISAESRSGAAQAELLRKLLTTRSAQSKRYDHPVLICRCADALRALGDTEGAMALWDLASDRQRDWGEPLWRIAKALYDTGAPVEAIGFAERAAARMPNDPRPAGLLTAARWRSRTVIASELLEAVDADLKRWPNESTLVPLSVVLSAIARDAKVAGERIDTALAGTPSLSVDALDELLEVDHARRLGRDQQLVAAMKSTTEGQSRLLIRQADWLMEEGKFAEALATLERAKSASTQGDEAAWTIRFAAARERTNDPNAARIWAKAADDNPSDVRLLARVVTSTACRDDLDLQKKTAERIRAATGDENGMLWRTATAETLLASPVATPEERDRAIALLTEVATRVRISAEPYRRLAIALDRAGRSVAAMAPLEQARRLRRTNVEIMLLSADIARRAGQSEKGREWLSAVAKLSGLSPAQRIITADLLEAYDDRTGAIRVLQAGPPDAARDLRLARMLAASNQTTEAAAAFTRLINHSDATPDDLLAGAAFFAVTGEPAKAAPFLDRLKTMNVPPQQLAVALARHEEQFESRGKAIERLTAAVAEFPKEPRLWRALAAAQARSGDWTNAQKSINAGLTAASTDRDLLALQSAFKAGLALPEPAEASDILLALIEDPQSEGGPALLAAAAKRQSALQKADTPAARDAAWAAYRADVIALSERHARFWPVQRAAILAHRAAGKPADASRLARAAMQRFPASAEAATLAFECLALTRETDAALEAARVWKGRLRGDTLTADLAITRLHLANRNRAAAEQTLAAYVRSHPLQPITSTSRPTSQPALLEIQNREAHLLYARALIELGRSREAADKLQPVLQDGMPGVGIWLSLADNFDKAVPARQWVDRGVAALAGDDAKPDAVAMVASAWLAAGRATSDIPMLRLALEKSAGATSIDALAIRAQAAHLLGEYDIAADAWRGILMKTNDPGAGNNLAYILLVRGRTEDTAEAYALAKKAAAVAGNDPGVLGTLAMAESRTGNRSAAVSGYRAALALDPDNVEAKIGLAEELSKGTVNERSEARKLLRDASDRLIGPSKALPELKKQIELTLPLLDAPDRK